MPRSIPPRTMRDLSRRQGVRGRGRSRLALNLTLGIGKAAGEPAQGAQAETTFPIEAFKKPRHWRFQIKPLFQKIRGPLVDVFHEAEEVLIIIDLGGFCRGDVSLHISPTAYVIHARRGDQEFREEIRLPPEVDIEQRIESFRNGVLEIVLPRKKHGETR